MSYEPNHASMHSSGWIAFTQANFAITATAMAIGVWAMPVTFWIRAFMAIGLLALISATVTVSKTVRDVHEAGKVTSKVETAKVERILNDFDPATG